LHDEIYREQTFIENAGYFAKHYPHTVVTNSVSKSNALTGLRLGWAIAPAHASAALVKTHAWVTSCADSFAQQVALHIFTSGALGEHASWYAQQRREVVRILEESGLRYIPPEGAFYACVQLAGTDSLAAAHSLADHYDVIAVPGVAFGSAFADWLRLTWVSASERLHEGLDRIRAFAEASSKVPG
jgi:aspartate/methionine/tyrosine aminotransferase